MCIYVTGGKIGALQVGKSFPTAKPTGQWKLLERTFRKSIKNLASDKSSLHASLKLFANLLHLKTENVGVVSSYLSTSWILLNKGFGQDQESRPLVRSNTGSPRFTGFPSLYACSESSLTNLIGCGLNLLCLQSHSKTECRWTWPEVAILGADQKERGLWEREWGQPATEY